MIRVLLCIVLAGAGHGLAFHERFEGSPAVFYILAAVYALLCGVALHFFWDQGTLLDRLEPRWGDLSIGAVTMLLLVLTALLGRSTLAPAGTPRQAWLYRIYLQIGDPDVVQNSILLTLLLVFIAAAEEIVWRGMVLDQLSARFGPRKGWLLATLAYTLSVLPTCYVLRVTPAGYNPLLPIAAFGCGLIWSFIAGRFGRLPPVIVSHAAFTYLMTVQFRLPGT